MAEELVVPEPDGVIRPAEIEAYELDVRERIRGFEDLDVLSSAVERVNLLAKALAKTKPAPYAMAAARRVEWQLGRVLGPPPTERGPRRSDASDLSKEEVYEFRLIGTLELPWDDVQSWAKSRNRLVKVARERRREPGTHMDIRSGRFQEVLADIEPASVPLILTDPPYAQDALPEYTDLATFAAEKLAPGGSLVCYVGQSTLPGALAAFSDSLRYWWCLALEHRGGGQQLPGKWVRIKWKPLLWFVKDERRDRTYVHDMLRGKKPDQELHEWAQGIDEVVPLIESLTEPNELVVDPFAGSGSFGHAALKIGRRFIGADDRV